MGDQFNINQPEADPESEKARIEVIKLLKEIESLTRPDPLLHNITMLNKLMFKASQKKEVNVSAVVTNNLFRELKEMDKDTYNELLPVYKLMLSGMIQRYIEEEETEKAENLKRFKKFLWENF